MAKYGFNEKGFSAFFEQIYRSDDSELLQQVALLTADPISYMAANFEIDVFALENFRSLNRSRVLLLGYSIGTALLGRRPITISFRRDKRAVKCEDICILLTCKISSHFSGNENSATGDVTIVVTSNR